jgi:nicotinamide mononucleotide transporter
MFGIELLAAIFLLFSVIFMSRRKTFGWPLGIVSVILYSIVFFDVHLYSGFVIQFIFLAQSIYGWIYWHKNRLKNSKILEETKVCKLNTISRLGYGIFIILIWLIAAFLFGSYTDATLPYVDALVATISVFANFLLASRKIETWILWWIADVIFILMFSYLGMYISMILYSLLLINAIYGFISWRKNL